MLTWLSLQMLNLTDKCQIISSLETTECSTLQAQFQGKKNMYFQILFS